MVIVCAPESTGGIEKHFQDIDQKCYQIGKVVEGDRKVTLI